MEGHEDEVLVCFSFSCDAWLYNLSRMPEESGYLRILSPKLTRTGGGQCALFWEKTTSRQLVMLGGTNGYVRCFRWKQSSYDCLWNIRVGSHPDVPVVFLYRIPNSSQLLAMNALGVVMIWEINRVEAVAFSCTGNEPALEYSYDFYPLIAPHLVTHNQGNYDGYIQRVISVSESSHSVPQDGRLFTLLFRSGLICTIDLVRKTVIDILPRYQHQAHHVPNVIGGRSNEAMTLHADSLSSLHNSSSSTEHNDVPNTINHPFQHSSITDIVTITSMSKQPITLLVQPGHDQSRNGSATMLRFLQWNHHHQHFSRRFQYQVPNSAKTGLLRSQLGTSVIESALLKCSYFSYTLPGQVVRAIPGECEILVSHDLQYYLGNTAATNSSISRSSDVLLQWLHLSDSRCGDSFRLSQLFTQACKIADYDSQEATIYSVRTNALVLNEPYQGPEVEDGYPRVQLRTKLLAQHHPSSVGSSSSSRYHISSNVTAYTNDVDFQSYLLLHECPIPSTSLNLQPSSVSSILTHPALPLIFLGQEDGRVLTLSSRRDHSFGEQSESTTSSSDLVAPGSDDVVLGAANSVAPSVLLVSTRIVPPHETQLPLSTQPVNNIWRADVMLSASYNRIQTRILDAMPDNRRTALVNTNADHDRTSALDEELQSMQSLFARPAAVRNGVPPTNVIESFSKNTFGQARSMFTTSAYKDKAIAATSNVAAATTPDESGSLRNTSVEVPIAPTASQSDKKATLTLLSDILGKKRKLEASATSSIAAMAPSSSRPNSSINQHRKTEVPNTTSSRLQLHHQPRKENIRPTSSLSTMSSLAPAPQLKKKILPSTTTMLVGTTPTARFSFLAKKT